jgi:hypothetical protein
MAAGTAERGSREPLLRNKEHEEEDFEQAIQRFLDAAYSDWPNKAGVSEPSSYERTRMLMLTMMICRKVRRSD